MFTLKQIEAFYWVAMLHGFGRAAEQLHTTQSTISKRVGELETILDCRLFEESAKRSELSARGRELLGECEEMLRCRDRILTRFSGKAERNRRLRIGITELTAMTWFPTFMESARELWPTVTLDPIVDSSDSLITQLEEDRIDYIIVPNVHRREPPNGYFIGTVRSSWICGAEVDLGQPATFSQLEDLTLITEETTSRIGAFFESWMVRNDLKFGNVIYCNNLMATAGLILSGRNFITNSMPEDYFSQYIKDGRMKILTTAESLPDIEYFSYSRISHDEIVHINSLAREKCDFSYRIF